MRHRVAKVQLNRDKDHTEALLRNLSTQLILNDKIDTTLAKAKAMRSHVEKIITYAIIKNRAEDKVTTFNAVKRLKIELATPEAIRKLLEDVAVRFAKTSGGYTRIVKIGQRGGDNAPMARIELTKPKLEEKKKEVKKNDK